jgi:adenylate cyclase
MGFHISAHASDSVIINDSIDSYPLGLHFEYFEDKSAALTFKEILSHEFNNKFISNKKKIANFGKTKSAFWFRFSIINRMSLSQELFLESTWPLYDRITLYIEEIKGDFSEKKYGNIYPFDEREIKHRNYIFNLNPPVNVKQTVYIRIQTDTSMQAPFTIWKKDAFFVNNQEDLYFVGFFFGTMIIMIFYNLFIFFTIKDYNYIYLSVYLLLQSAFQLSFLGLLNQFILTEHPLLNIHSMPLFLGLAAIASLFFSKSFLNVKQYNLKLNYLYIAFIISFLILTVFSIFTIYIPLKIINLFGIIFLLLLTFTSYYILKKGYQPAKYFFYSWVFIIFGSGIQVFKNLGILENNFLTTNSMMIGTAIQISFLSLALSDRINTIKRDLINHQIFALDVQTRMTNSFARFVPKEFLKYLSKESIVDVELGNQVQKNMTVLFSDIRSFTTLSEQMTPQENFNFLNSYLKRVGPIVRSNNGFIDKYIGDAVMALFSESPEDAINTAIQMQRNIFEYNTQRKNNNYQEILIGIGLHCGNLMLGTIGEENRMEGTVISDDVNLTSRIESLTKYYDVSILISSRLLKKLQNKNQYNYRVIDSVIVKGKNKPITLIEILDEQTTKYYDLKIKTKSQFIKAIKLYRERLIDEAFKIFNEISTEMNGLDTVIEIYKDRCKLLLQNGIPDDWNGIERLDSK